MQFKEIENKLEFLLEENRLQNKINTDFVKSSGHILDLIESNRKQISGLRDEIIKLKKEIKQLKGECNGRNKVFGNYCNA